MSCFGATLGDKMDNARVESLRMELMYSRMANKILFYSAVADTSLQSCLLPLQHPTYIMRPEDVSTIFWAYLLLGDGEMLASANCASSWKSRA